MKNIYITLVFLFITLSVYSQADNMTLMSQYNPGNMTVHNGLKYNDTWGYTAGNGDEYALVGTADSVVIIKVNSCTDTKRVTAYAGGSSVTWRDIKTYGRYVYSVCDGCSEGLKIADMGNIDNGIVTVTTNTSFFTRAHDIYVDLPAGRLYACGTNTGGGTDLVVLDIATDPSNPTLLKNINFNDITGGTQNFYVHDLHVTGNIAYCSHAQTGLYIWDLTDLNNIPMPIASYDTPGYSHSSWPSGNGYVYSADENNNPPQPITVLRFDGSDLFFERTISDPLESSGLPSVHNPYVVGNNLFVSNYEDGLQVWDITNPAAPTSTAHYDTYPDNNGGSYTGYEGNWGVYPFFGSECIVATDITYGAHFLKMGIISVPVTWNELTVEAINNKTSEIKWSTESEVNNEYFEVMRSKDGNTFESIGRVEPKSDGATEHSYEYTDNTPYLGNNYYKIKQVDYDGKYTYSDTKTVSFKLDQKNITVFPNPIRDQFTLNIASFNSSQVQAQIHNSAGALVFNKEIHIEGSKQANLFNFNLDNPVSAGAYTLSLFDGDILLWSEQVSIIQ